MYVKFYTVLKRYDEYENFIKNIVNNVRSEMSRRGIDPDRLSLTLIKIKPEIINEVLKLLNEPEAKPPANISYLIQSLRQDNINNIPALIINDKKVFEGSPANFNKIKEIIYMEADKEFNLELTKEVKELIKPEVKITPPELPTPKEYVAEVRKEIVPKIILGKPRNCEECVYYGLETRYCFSLGVKIENVNNPPCR